MSDLVIDCSIVMSWHFEDESDPYAEAVLDCLSEMTARVPALFHLEVLNVLLIGERRRRTTTQKSDGFLQYLNSLRIETEPAVSSETLASILSLARAHQLTAYDAMYLETARRNRLPLATLDEPLRAASQREGAPLFDPPHRGG